MENKFNGKVVLVTGAGMGIGRTIAQRFAAEGAKVMTIDLAEEPLAETASASDNISWLVADMVIDANLDMVTTEIKKRYGRLDILVNNAGWAPVTSFSEVKMEEYDKVFGINVRALVNMTLHVLPLIKAAKGNIINISSDICQNHLPNMSMYAGTKAAVDIFTQIWAKELAADGVRVNAVSVGPIKTPIYDKTDLDAAGIKAHIERVTKAIPLGHFGRPEDVAAVISFLASDEAKFVTGSIYGVDGGFGA